MFAKAFFIMNLTYMLVIQDALKKKKKNFFKRKDDEADVI